MVKREVGMLLLDGIKTAEHVSEWDYQGPPQPEPDECVRCGCCGTYQLDDGWYCSGFCDRNAVHPPEEPDYAEQRDRAEYARLKAKYG